jgi:transcription antitermination factor NusG
LIEAAIPAEGNALSLVGNPPRSWYAVFTRSNHEKRVAEYYAKHRIEHFLPLYHVVHNWTNNRKAALDLPLFPGYLFVHTAPQERLPVLRAPGTLGLVGCGNVPTPLPDLEIESLRTRLQRGSFEPYPYLAAGARVRVRTGSLAGMEGVVVRKKNSLRVVLTLNLIMQSVAVEVDGDELEPITSTASRC